MYSSREAEFRIFFEKDASVGETGRQGGAFVCFSLSLSLSLSLSCAFSVKRRGSIERRMNLIPRRCAGRDELQRGKFVELSVHRIVGAAPTNHKLLVTKLAEIRLYRLVMTRLILSDPMQGDRSVPPSPFLLLFLRSVCPCVQPRKSPIPLEFEKCKK